MPPARVPTSYNADMLDDRARSLLKTLVERYIADGHLEAVRLGRKTLRVKVDSIERLSPNAHDPASSKAPPLETIRLVYHTIRWVYEITGAEYVDSWSSNDS